MNLLITKHTVFMLKHWKQSKQKYCTIRYCSLVTSCVLEMIKDRKRQWMMIIMMGHLRSLSSVSLYSVSYHPLPRAQLRLFFCSLNRYLDTQWRHSFSHSHIERERKLKTKKPHRLDTILSGVIWHDVDEGIHSIPCMPCCPRPGKELFLYLQ